MRTYKNHIELTNEQKEMMELMGYVNNAYDIFAKTISNSENPYIELELVVNPYDIDSPAVIYVNQLESFLSTDEVSVLSTDEVSVPIKTILREIKNLKDIGVNIDIEEIEGF